MNLTNAALFLLAAVILLGSPGPAIAALLAVGRAVGFRQSMPFFWGLQAGLALGAGVSAAGLASLLLAFPFAVTVMSGIAALYLLWLAFKIGFAPLGGGAGGASASSAWSGFLLGATNPKAYLAFISLIASHMIFQARPSLDAAVKWSWLVLIMIAVDLIWLYFGAVLGSVSLRPDTERALNYAMGATIALTALLPFF